MLEYLLNFIQHNIIFIFFCVLFLAIASMYSKKVKYLFITGLTLAALYFALLCLYRLGIGIESLYLWSCKYAYLICSYLDQLGIVFIHSETIFIRLMKLFMLQGFENAMGNVFYIFIAILSIYIAINSFLPAVRGYISKKIEIKDKIIIKIKKIINNIKEKQPKFILNSVIRC